MDLKYVALAIPLIFVFVLAEYLYARSKDMKIFRFNDSMNNISFGIAERLFDVFYAIVMLVLFEWIYQNFALFEIPVTWITGFFLFVCVDFLWYWYHRAGHEVNVFWGAHIIHHQSEEFNYTIPFRISGFQAVIRTLFWSFLPLIGFQPKIILIVVAAHGLYQFLLHTKTIGKLGWLEHILVTPSHHRVHHGRNKIYLDKNYGGTFIIWDKLFGTFEEEQEQVYFGVTKQFHSFNPIWAYVHYWKELWDQSKRISNIKDKILLFIKPPGWTPQEISNETIIDPASQEYDRKKYNPVAPLRLRLYVLTHVVFNIISLMGLIFIQNLLPMSDKVQLAIIITWTIINCSVLQEFKRWAFFSEFGRLVIWAISIPIYFKGTIYMLPAMVFGVLVAGVSMAWLFEMRDLFSGKDGERVLT